MVSCQSDTNLDLTFNVSDDRVTRDETVPATKSGWFGRRYLLVAAAIILLFILAAGIFAIIAYIYPLFPRAVAMAIVAERGFRSEYERYRQTFAKQGVQLTLVRTEGFIENLAMLRSLDSGVSVALVQNGLTDPQQSPELASLGTVGYVPLWIFYLNPHASLDQLAQLRGMRVAVGPTGSGTRKLALELLARNGIDESNTELLTLPPNEASERLVAGNIQAAMMLAAPDAPAVQRLLVSPDIKLMSISHADTYVALYPFLTTVVLPAGFADLPHERPPSDVKMIAIKMSLVVRRDLQSAVQYLLLEAATQIHSSPGVFQKAGQFPAAEGPDLPLSPDAQQFYKTGIPLLQRYLPLWLAVLIEQLAITLLPVGAIAYPLLRGLPAFYNWGMRRRISMLYGELKLVELSLENESRDRLSALSELSRLEHRVSHLRVPPSFAHLLYALRQDISLVRERLDKTTERP